MRGIKIRPAAPAAATFPVLFFLSFGTGSPAAKSSSQNCTVPAQREDLVINEILFDSGEGPLEFVELFNRSDCPVSLDALTISDARGTREPVRAPGPLTPGSFVVLASDARLFADKFGEQDVLVTSRWPALNNGGDAVVVALSGILMDSVKYGGTWSVAGRSLERRNPHIPSVYAENWGPSVDPSGATPGRTNTLLVDDSDPPSVAYAEQEDGRMLYARFTESLDVSAVEPGHFSVGGVSPDVAEPYGSASELRLRFRSDVEAGVLRVAGIRDLAGNTASPHEISIALLPSPGQLVVNEIMFDPRADSEDGLANQAEYVELINRSQTHLALRDLSLGEAADESGNVGSTIITDQRRTIVPGGFLVAYQLAGAPSFGAGPPPEFAAFAGDAGMQAAWIGVPRLTVRGLSNSGQQLSLLRSDGLVLDSVDFQLDWHSLTLQELAETRGTALERRALDGPSNDPANWTSSVARSGGTPGAPNSVRGILSNARSGRPGLHVSPSPFSPDDDGYEDAVEVSYRLRSTAAATRLYVYDMQGRRVRVLMPAGWSGAEGVVVWDGRDESGRILQTGIYIVLLESMSAEPARFERYKGLVTLVRGR